jgi:thiamine-phosphate pyrophosphorylase
MSDKAFMRSAQALKQRTLNSPQSSGERGAHLKSKVALETFELKSPLDLKCDMPPDPIRGSHLRPGALAALALRLNREAGAPPVPALYFFTDPLRTPDPVQTARTLPRGTAIVYRHFGAPDRRRVARRLRDVAHTHGLALLIAADPALAAQVGADGVHWPERRLPDARDASLVTASAHSFEAAQRAAQAGVDAVVLGPVLPTRSASGNQPLGLFRASQIAHALPAPVIALGGVNRETARQFLGRGFAGLAAVDAFVSD